MVCAWYVVRKRVGRDCEYRSARPVIAWLVLARMVTDGKISVRTRNKVSELVDYAGGCFFASFVKMV